MADSHEEQLLSDLLTGIAREDARVDATHLEERVMAAMDSSPAVRLKGDTTYYLGRHFVAASVVMAVFVSTLLWITPAPQTDKVRLKAVTTEVAISIPTRPTRPASPARPNHSNPTNSTNLTNLTNPTNSTNRTNPTNRPNSTNRTNPTKPTNPTLSEPPSDDFVPLMPMTERELAGPFQLVRVQMPRASLGTLRSPLERPNELVEADVLLGEDGMARAIRVSASGSVYPWRSR